MARSSAATTPNAQQPKIRRLDKTHWLYIAVIAAVILGVVLGLIAQSTSGGATNNFATALKPLGDLFVNLIKMLIAPVIFCTIVTGIGSVAKAATIGKVGGLALIYFLVMSTVALFIGLMVGNVVHPGEGLKLSAYKASGGSSGTGNALFDFIASIIPPGIPVLPTLFVALLVGFAVQRMGKAGEPILKFVKIAQALVFRLLMMIMWLAPIGAFGAIAAVVGATGFKAVNSMLILMVAFYVTCILFIAVILGGVLYAVARVNIFKLMKYLAREYLLIFATSSSESALPRLIAKMEHLGVSRPVVGVTVPTGYSFNLDGTAIYLSMGALFVANAMNVHMDFGAQVALLVFMVIASKGAAGVTGAGLATLAAGLESHKPELLQGMGVIVGIDRFMSEARALTNFTGNAVATVVVGKWVKEVDLPQVHRVLNGQDPFLETMMQEDHTGFSTSHSPDDDGAASPEQEPVPAR